MKNLVLLLVLASIILTGCSAQKPAADESAGTNAPAVTIVKKEEQAAVPADNVILIDNKTETIIYEDEYCSVAANWISKDGMTGTVKKKVDEMSLAFYMEDVTINGHPVTMGKYEYIPYNGKEYWGIGICSILQNRTPSMWTVIGPDSSENVVGMQPGEKITEMSFVLRVINLDAHPEGEPNVSQRITLRRK